MVSVSQAAVSDIEREDLRERAMSTTATVVTGLILLPAPTFLLVFAFLNLNSGALEIAFRARQRTLVMSPEERNEAIIERLDQLGGET